MEISLCGKIALVLTGPYRLRLRNRSHLGLSSSASTSTSSFAPDDNCTQTANATITNSKIFVTENQFFFEASEFIAKRRKLIDRPINNPKFGNFSFLLDTVCYLGITYRFWTCKKFALLKFDAWNVNLT